MTNEEEEGKESLGVTSNDTRSAHISQMVPTRLPPRSVGLCYFGARSGDSLTAPPMGDSLMGI